ncbi:hypothetical protein R1sor_019956 [Riccia sorocarpa]|uniref:S-adenosyl-L-methionine-dependent methyltransferase n=1 Tax=Riccia sorocarpa TaxID=122646 RepID=A0ABD3IFN5_9MARC
MEMLMRVRLPSPAPAILLVSIHTHSQARSQFKFLLSVQTSRPASLSLGQSQTTIHRSRERPFPRDINFSCAFMRNYQKGRRGILNASAGRNLLTGSNSSPCRSRNCWQPPFRSTECRVRKHGGIRVFSTSPGGGEGQDSAKSNVTSSSSRGQEWAQEIPAEETKFLASIRTRYNYVRVLEISKASDHPLAGARVLLLDRFGNVHSVYHEYRLLTDSYYDIFPSLPTIIPDGPIAILGLGAGTAARIIHHFWPEIDLHGWELDPAVIFVARKFFDLDELEWSEDSNHKNYDSTPLRQGFIDAGSYRKWKRTSFSVFMEDADAHRPKGRLRVMVGDALSSEVSIEGGFAGIIVDLFTDGAVIPALQDPQVWREMKKKLRPGGRIMVNCGGGCVDAGEGKKDGRVTMEETIAAMAEEFPGELSILPLRRLPFRRNHHLVFVRLVEADDEFKRVRKSEVRKRRDVAYSRRFIVRSEMSGEKLLCTSEISGTP